MEIVTITGITRITSNLYQLPPMGNGVDSRCFTCYTCSNLTPSFPMEIFFNLAAHRSSEEDLK